MHGSDGLAKILCSILILCLCLVEVNGHDATRTILPQKLAKEIFNQSSCFLFIARPEKTDYLLVINVDWNANQPRNNNEFPNIFWSIFTLGIIPLWTTESITVVADLKDIRGTIIGRREIKQNMTTLIQLFMLIGMPFVSPKTVEQKMWLSIIQDLDLWANQTMGRARTAG